MPARQDPRSEIFHEWAIGEDGWAGQMDANLRRISRAAYHLSVISKTVATPPATPADGDTYIVGTGATGDWSGFDNQLAYWDGQAATPGWQIFNAVTGMWAYIQDEGRYNLYDGTAWIEHLHVDSPLSAPASAAGVLDIDTAKPFNEVTLTESVTTLNLNNPPAAGRVREVVLALVQNATGGWTVTWPTSVDWGSAGAPTLSTAANARDVVRLTTYDGGTSWKGEIVGLGYTG